MPTHSSDATEICVVHCRSLQVVDEGFNPTYGARPLRRAIMRLVEERGGVSCLFSKSREPGEDELAESFLKEPTREGEHILMDVNADGNVP